MKRLSVLLAATLLIGAAPAVAAPPVNDDFADRIVVSSLPFTTVIDTTEATWEEEEESWCGFGAGSVWFEFTAEQRTRFELSTQGSSYSVGVNLYPGHIPGYPDAWWNGDCHWPAGPWPLPTIVRRILEPGERIFIQLMPYELHEPGGELHVSMSERLAPNDAFASAEVIASLPFGTTHLNDFYTLEPDEPASCVDDGNVAGFREQTLDASAWFRYSPSQNESVYVSASQPVSVFTGASLGTLALVACGAQAAFHATSGETYFIRVHASEHSQIAVNVEAWSMVGGIAIPGQVLIGEDVPRPLVVSGHPRDDGLYDVTVEGPDGITVTRGIFTGGRLGEPFRLTIVPPLRFTGLRVVFLMRPDPTWFGAVLLVEVGAVADGVPVTKRVAVWPLAPGCTAGVC